MPDNSDSKDINEQVVDDWVAENTPFERVKSIMRHTYDPMPPDAIAAQARTSLEETRTHLQTLAANGFVDQTRDDTADEAPLYKRSPVSRVLENARDIHHEVDADTIEAKIDTMETDLAQYRDEYGVDDPTTLTTPTDTETKTETEPDAPAIDPETLMDWRTTRQHLAFAKVALALSNAVDTIRDEST